MKENMKYIIIGFFTGIFIILMAGVIPAVLTFSPKADKETDDKAEVDGDQYTDAGTYYHRGIESVSKNDYKEGVINFNKAVGIDPARADAYRELGKAYLELGDQENAKKYMDISRELEPDDADMLFQTARIKLFEEEYDATLKILDDLIKTQENKNEGIYLYSILLSADTYIILKEYDKAGDLAERALNISPGNAWAEKIIKRIEEGLLRD